MFNIISDSLSIIPSPGTYSLITSLIVNSLYYIDYENNNKIENEVENVKE